MEKALSYDNDPVKYVENGLKAVVLNKGPELPGMLRGLGGALANAGFFAIGLEYVKRALELDGDSAA